MAKAKDFDGSANETEVILANTFGGKKKQSILGVKARTWLLTINNPSVHGVDLAQKSILQCIEKEIGDERIAYVACVMEQSLTTDAKGNHTPHAHIILYFPAQAYGSQVHKLFPTAALQNCAANVVSVRQYIRKDPTGAWYKNHPEKISEKLPDREAGFWEWGKIPDGKRYGRGASEQSGVGEDIVSAIQAGQSDAEIIAAYPCIWHRTAELRKIRYTLMSQKYRTRYRNLNCIYIEANLPPQEIHNLYPSSADTYVVSDYTHPWDSYSAEKTVVFLNYLGQFSWYDIRRYLDGCYCTLSARFSDAVACYDNVLIISPLPFADMCSKGKSYISSILVKYLTHARVYSAIGDDGTDYVLDPETGRWKRAFLLPAHEEPKK